MSASAKDLGNKLPPGVDMIDCPAGFDRERLNEVINIKEQANAKFKEGDYFSAKCLYSGGLEMLERCCLHLEKADETWEGIKNNIAFCDLKRKEWTRVIDTTTEILTRNPVNTKALYRRAVARIGDSKFAEAQRDLQTVLELEPNNVDARQKLAEILKESKERNAANKEQASKMRGFLRGERLDDTVAVTEDGGVRKLHGNENAPLFSAWIKRAWLSPKSGLTACVTAHIVMRTQDGKEIYNTRKPPGALAPQQAGPQLAMQSKPAGRPAQPARWVLDDDRGVVFKAWNSAAKSMQLHEMAKFEAAKYTIGPSVETCIERCIATWLGDSPERREMYRDVPEDVVRTALRRQALQILALPEDFCLQQVQDPNTTINMDMELLEVSEFTDVDRDGRLLLHTIKKGKPRCDDVPVIGDLCTVTAHFKISKLLVNFGLVDTRMGLASDADGMVMREDKTKEPIQFIVGEEDAAPEGEFVPPCIGQCLQSVPGGVVEGMQFEMILRDGVPISDMGKQINLSYADGMNGALPNTSGPVILRIEVERVSLPLLGPSTASWRGVPSIQEERSRAEALEAMDEGRHRRKAVKRWRRILAWLEQLLAGRRWKLQGGAAAGDSMYDLEWEDDDEDGAQAGAPATPLAAAHTTPATRATVDLMPEMFEVEDDLLKQLQSDELEEWAIAHVALAQLFGPLPPEPPTPPEAAKDPEAAQTAITRASVAAVHAMATDPALSQKHARCAVQAATVGDIPRDVEIRSRLALSARLLESDQAKEALEVLRPAQALDRTNSLVKDQMARATQMFDARQAVDVKETLRAMKVSLGEALDSDDKGRLRELLETMATLPLTWEAASETAVGKEVGRCAKLEDQTVAELAKAIVATLHKLAKQQRPMWAK